MIIDNSTPPVATLIIKCGDDAADVLETALQVGLCSDQFPKMVQVAFVAPDKTYPTSHEKFTKSELREALLIIPFSRVDNSRQRCMEVVVGGGVGASVGGVGAGPGVGGVVVVVLVVMVGKLVVLVRIVDLTTEIIAAPTKIFSLDLFSSKQILI